ncbi:ATP-binding cassette domain-containing protein [Plantactinospora sp. GCM10030261]|uniref:branched-chain amino acid ABC transporter ATP-binding protein/permease n=1 Tax=Plantactinospora sp. GCM10030261 TaxID=3273420 RepID=UPI003618C966
MNNHTNRPQAGSYAWLAGPIITFTALLAAASVLAAQGNTYVVYLYGVGLVYATATLGLHLLFNDCGEISLAQAALVALGGFVGAHMYTLVPGPIGPFALVAGSVLAGAICGAVAAIPMLRLRGMAVAVATLLLNAAVFHYVLRLPAFGGGSGGLRLRSATWLPDDDLHAISWLTVITIVTTVAIQFLRRGRFGLGLRAIRANDDLARSVGVATQRYRVTAYSIAGAAAGVAGAMWVILHQGIAPSAFTDASSLVLLTMALLGGRGSIVGPITAAISTGLLTGLLGRYGILISFLAPAILLVVLIKYPGGLNEQLRHLREQVEPLRRHLQLRAARPIAASPSPVTDPAAPPPPPPGPSVDHGRPHTAERAATGPRAEVLRCSNMHIAFGGLVAVADVSLTVQAGEMLALVGPNGAGKSTLLNSISGHRPPTRGTVHLTGIDISTLPAHQRAALGLRRTFQVGGHMSTETGYNHVRLGMHTHATSPIPQAVGHLAGRLGIAEADLRATMRDLPAGVTRLVEIATALAAPGHLLLLDEPTVGLTPPERDNLASILKDLASEGTAIILVDHDTSFVAKVAHRVVALDTGRVIADAAPHDVFNNPAFVDAYLGGGLEVSP